jgi:hypothetical protein
MLENAFLQSLAECLLFIRHRRLLSDGIESGMEQFELKARRARFDVELAKLFKEFEEQGLFGGHESYSVSVLIDGKPRGAVVLATSPELCDGLSYADKVVMTITRP